MALLLKAQNPSVRSTHCFLHREALVAKTSPKRTVRRTRQAVDIVDFIKVWPLKILKIFSLLCKEMGAEHRSLLLHTAVHWLSRGKVLARLDELREELRVFLSAENSAHAELLGVCMKLAYLADIFKHLNELNSKMQGKEENLLNTSDKLRGFKSKLTLWHSCEGRVEMFALYSEHSKSQPCSGLISQHLQILDE